jgi:hypothetical protein
MIGRIDELIQRLFSFFVLPVLNVTIVSLLLHWCLADQYSVSSLVAKLDIGGITQYFANVLGAIVSGNFDTIKDLAGRYSNQIAAVSNIVALMVFLTIVILMFVLDRAIYAVNWIIPLDFNFDLASYGAQHCDDTRVRRLFSLLGQPFDFTAATGVVRSYLGEHSVDAYRVVRRNALVRSQGIARTGFDYAKSYVCLLVVAWLFALVAPVLKLSSITVLLAVGVVIGLAYLVWYANAYQELLEFDIDGFIALRFYDKGSDRFVKPAEEEADLCTGLARPVSNSLLDTLCLKHHPAGMLYEIYGLGCRLVAWAKARRAAPS